MAPTWHLVFAIIGIILLVLAAFGVHHPRVSTVLLAAAFIVAAWLIFP